MSRRASLVARELLPWLAPLVLAAAALLWLPRVLLPRTAPTARALPPPRADSVTLPTPAITRPVARPPTPRAAPAPAPSPIAPPGDFPPPLPALGGRVLPPPPITPADAGRTDLPRAWTRVNQLRAWASSSSARDGGAGSSMQNALLRNEIGLILEEAGFGEEPFASRVRAWREAVGDGGEGLAPRERFFLPEDAERLRVWDAVRAIEGAPP